jgi:uncharacterized membrane protein YbhN (UPF0104 family)
LTRWVKLVGLVVLCGWFVARLDAGAVRAALSSPRWVLAATALYALGHLANAEAWRGLVNAGGPRLTTGEAIEHELGSTFWGTVLPGGVGGEVVKGVRIARAGASGPSVAVALVAARIVSGVTTCALGLVLVPASGFPAHAAVATGLAACAGGGLAVLGGLRFAPDLPLLRRVPRGPLPGGRALLAAAGLATLARLLFVGMFQCAFAAAGEPLRFADAAVMSAIVAVAQLLPVTLGGFGVRELSIGELGRLLSPGPAPDAAALVVALLVTATVCIGGATEARRARGGGERA